MNTTTIDLNGAKLEFNCIMEVGEDKNVDIYGGEDADRFLCKLAYMLIHGMNSCYKDIGEYMLDLTMDIAWTKERHEKEVADIKNHPAFGVIEKAFTTKYPGCELF